MKTVLISAVLLLSYADALAFDVERVFPAERHSRGDTNVRPVQPIDEASWIWMHGCEQWGGSVFSATRATPEELIKAPQRFLRFRREFAAVGSSPLEFDVSADERFIIMLDGREIARGPMRGLRNRWHYQSYKVTNLRPGSHVLEAVVWQLGEHAPLAQVSVRGGFILKAAGIYDGALTTGRAHWRVGILKNTRMTDKGTSGAFGVGSQCEVRGCSFLDEQPHSWEPAVVVRGPVEFHCGLLAQGWMLYPSGLRDMMCEPKSPGVIRSGPDILGARPAVIPPNSRVTILWDLGNYYCAYPLMRVSNGEGAVVRWDWAECLTDADGNKGDRAAWKNLDMPNPFGDVFLPDGSLGARFTTPWWRAGRWCRLTISTADCPISLDGIKIVETRYPVGLKATFSCDDAFVDALQPVCARSLEMCMHEMFFDCPYYEQQMYPGDSRLQFLVSGLFDVEDRMVRNAITLFDCDRRENGMIPMNCPTRGAQDALGFTCCELMTLADYAWNHTNREWLKARLPGANQTLMALEAFTDEDGLLRKTPGWNFLDWTDGWSVPNVAGGVPPDGDSDRPNCELNLQYLLAILSVARAEEAVGDTGLSVYWRGRARRLGSAIRDRFWVGDKSLFASNVAKDKFSEHSQCLALLTDVVTGEEAERCFGALIGTSGLARCTIYYKHYFFETCFKFRRADLFFRNLGFWRDCLDMNFSTIPETPDVNSRSDCHGWGSHPIWHLHTGVAGVKSAAPFYKKVLVEPQPAHLKSIRSSTPTPKGDVKLDLSFYGTKVCGTVALPEGLSGTFRWNGVDAPLSSGRNAIDFWGSAESKRRCNAESGGSVAPGM